MSYYRTRTWRDKTFTPIRYFGYVPVNEAVDRVKASRSLDDPAAQDWLAFNMQPVQMSHRNDRRAIILNERGRPIPIPREFWASVDVKFLFKTGGTQVIWHYGGGSDEGAAYVHEGWLNEVLGQPVGGATEAPPRATSESLDPSRSGFGGRPTIKHIILPELKRRGEAGELCEGVGAEAKFLCGWAAEKFKDDTTVPIPGPDGVENIIRSDYHALVAKGGCRKAREGKKARRG